MKFFAVLYSSTLLSGGIRFNEETEELNLTKVTQVFGASRYRLPNFPQFNNREQSFVQMNNGDILSCVGEIQQCFILENRKWVEHSIMNKVRIGAVGIQMPNGTYMFGGNESPNTSEFLPNNSTVWEQGPDIPYFISSLSSLSLNFLKKLSMLPLKCNYKVRGHAISKNELILIHEDLITKGHSYDNHDNSSCKGM